jgi:integrase
VTAGVSRGADRFEGGGCPPGCVARRGEVAGPRPDRTAPAGRHALSSYMGHSSVAITLDRYGHLMPGNEAEAVTLLDTYLSAGTGC